MHLRLRTTYMLYREKLSIAYYWCSRIGKGQLPDVGEDESLPGKPERCCGISFGGGGDTSGKIVT